MNEVLRVVAVVPARGGYDEVPYLNIKKLGPDSTDCSHASSRRKRADTSIGSSSPPTMIRWPKSPAARGRGSFSPSRPSYRARYRQLKPVVAHAVEFLEKREGYRIDIVVILQATSPFRTAEQIDAAIDKLVEEGFDSVISLCEEKALTWRCRGWKLEAPLRQSGTPG